MTMYVQCPVRGASLPPFALYNYAVMNNLPQKTITAVDIGNCAAWTVLQSHIMANGSLLTARELMVMVKKKGVTTK